MYQGGVGIAGHGEEERGASVGFGTGDARPEEGARHGLSVEELLVEIGRQIARRTFRRRQHAADEGADAGPSDDPFEPGALVSEPLVEIRELTAGGDIQPGRTTKGGDEPRKIRVEEDESGGRRISRWAISEARTCPSWSGRTLSPESST